MKEGQPFEYLWSRSGQILWCKYLTLYCRLVCKDRAIEISPQRYGEHSTLLLPGGGRVRIVVEDNASNEKIGIYSDKIEAKLANTWVLTHRLGFTVAMRAALALLWPWPKRARGSGSSIDVRIGEECERGHVETSNCSTPIATCVIERIVLRVSSDT